MGLTPLGRPERVGRGPEAAAVSAGFLLGFLQIGWRCEPVKNPGMALGDQFTVEVPLVDPEGTEQAVVLVTAVGLQPDGLAPHLLFKCRAGLLAMGLAVFRRVNAQEANPLLATVCGHRRDGVAIVHGLNRPGFCCWGTGLRGEPISEQARDGQHQHQPDHPQQSFPRQATSRPLSGGLAGHGSVNTGTGVADNDLRN